MSGRAGGWVLGPVLALTLTACSAGHTMAKRPTHHGPTRSPVTSVSTTTTFLAGPGAASTTTASASGLVPALQTHDPMVIVTPSNKLSNGQQVEVRVTGFGLGGKVWLSECADAAEANDEGCGHGLPAQTLLVTDNTGSGSMAFQVQSSAPPKANDYAMTDLQPCADNCVVVATLGGGYGFLYATVKFHGDG